MLTETPAQCLTPSICFEPSILPVADTPQCNTSDVLSSYDGSNVVFRLLRLNSWGPALLNLGFYRFHGMMSPLNLIVNTEKAQQRLVRKSIDLLDVKRKHHVLDLACGRGKSSFIVQCLFPESTVTGVDLLEDHVHVARTLFGEVDNLSYRVGNAERLDLADESFDRVMCIEAAFHFPDRAEFLREAYRVLRPGGRLVVVDFAWNTDSDRIRRHEAEIMLVRKIWQWDDLFSIPDYQRISSEIGFQTSRVHDWSHRVTAPIQKTFEYISYLGNRSWGRKLLEYRNSLFRSLTKQDWKDIAQAVRAHKCARSCTRYMAFVFEKPANPSKN